MATVVMMQHPETGIIKKGFWGISWTTFFFGGFPALCRGQILIGFIFIILHSFTFCISGIIWAFIYNKKYTQELFSQGYKFADSESKNIEAMMNLDIPVKPENTINGKFESWRDDYKCPHCGKDLTRNAHIKACPHCNNWLPGCTPITNDYK